MKYNVKFTSQFKKDLKLAKSEQITQGMAVLSLTYPMKESTRPL